MRLLAPEKAPKVTLRDIEGNIINVAEGRRTYLAFFRDASCPFCNMHIYKLTQNYDKWAALGLNMIAVFASTPEEVKRFILVRPRPFPVAAEPTREAYDIYGLQSSFGGKVKAIFTRFFTFIKGMMKVGFSGLTANNIMPADFLIDETGHLVEAYYGKDAGDHISFERIEQFLAEGLINQKLKETATNTSGEPNLTPPVATFPFSPIEKVPVSYLCNAYAEGNTQQLERVSYPSWKYLLTALRDNLALGASSPQLKKLVENAIQKVALTEIKTTQPTVHAVERITISEDSFAFILQKLETSLLIESANNQWRLTPTGVDLMPVLDKLGD